jgi:hypothetical protein
VQTGEALQAGSPASKLDGLLFSIPSSCERREIFLFEPVAGHTDDPCRRLRAHGCTAHAVFQQRALADDRPGSQLGDDLPVDLDVEEPVEDEVELVSLLALFDEYRAFVEVFRLRALLHELA